MFYSSYCLAVTLLRGGKQQLPWHPPPSLVLSSQVAEVHDRKMQYTPIMDSATQYIHNSLISIYRITTAFHSSAFHRSPFAGTRGPGNTFASVPAWVT